MYKKLSTCTSQVNLQVVTSLALKTLNSICVILIFCLDLATKSSSPSPKKKSVQAALPFGKPKTSAASKSTSLDVKKAAGSSDGGHSSSPVKGGSDENSKDNSFREFRRICVKLAEEPSYNAKSKILSDFFEKGSSGGTYMYNLLTVHVHDT